MTLHFCGKAPFPLATHRLSFHSAVYDGGGAGSTSSSLALTLAGPGGSPAAMLERALWPAPNTWRCLSTSWSPIQMQNAKHVTLSKFSPWIYLQGRYIALCTVCINNSTRSNLRPLKNVHAAGTCYKAVFTTSLAKVDMVYLKLGQLWGGTIVKFLFVSRDKYLTESYKNFKSAQSQT